MHRFYLPPEKCRGDRIVLRDREAHHARDVLRLRPGDCAVVLDGAGGRFDCTVAEVDREAVTLHPTAVHQAPPLGVRVTLLVGVPKGRLMETIVDQATQLGVSRIVPLFTERVVVQLDAAGAREKQTRWQSAAVTALKQCGGPWLPVVAPPVSPRDFLARGESFTLSLVAALAGESQSLREALSRRRASDPAGPTEIALWIGPEGDFTPAEMAEICASGATPISLGPRVLRVETAALAALAIVQHELAEWPTA